MIDGDTTYLHPYLNQTNRFLIFSFEIATRCIRLRAPQIMILQQKHATEQLDGTGLLLGCVPARSVLEYVQRLHRTRTAQTEDGHM
ncbi:hypothetical protein TNCV_1409531 [Trichonephila clavipes]|uniref:Uncharacterized protein n=1 Tax=Trichonephila clavipes TaxID=2585209 RepID=A0A8X6R1R9_TRICX|nr:hypothetical protein TNCV_1409531 [Trichonephila clavipes]